MAETFSKDDRVRPFSNGTEYHLWLDSNCMRGEKGCRNYRPNAATSRHGCPIEVGLCVGCMVDGTIPMGIALRGGFVEPGPNGELVDATFVIASDGIPARRIGLCPEFRGYDEPPDPRPRSPRPPEGQLDIFDPRNVPDREPVFRGSG